MTEKQSGIARRQPPPISLRTYKVQRSRSISNGLEREPQLQPVRLLERRTSIASADLGVTQNIEKRKKVAQLIERYEQSESCEYVHRSVNNLHLLSSSTPAHRSANKSKIFNESFNLTQ
jgi:hypothetical protein